MLRVVTRTSCGRIVEELVHTRLPARYAAPLAALLPEAEHLFGVPIIASSTRRGTVYVGPANAGQQIGPLTVPRMPLLTAWVLGAVTCMRHAAERSA